MELCDDCGKEYPGPAYYTFETEGCHTYVDDEETPHDDCTGNLCVPCTGPYLAPDDPKDPRWIIDTLDAAQNAIWLHGLERPKTTLPEF